MVGTSKSTSCNNMEMDFLHLFLQKSASKFNVNKCTTRLLHLKLKISSIPDAKYSEKKKVKFKMCN